MRLACTTWVLLLALALLAMPAFAARPPPPPEPPVVEGGTVLVRATGEAPTRVRLEVPKGAQSLWLNRAMVDAVWLESPQRGALRGVARGFFRPDPGEPLFPAALELPLPPGTADTIDLQVRTEAPVRLRPQWHGAAQAQALQQTSGVIAGAIYASLLVLSLVALSLYAAVRDRAYLALLAFAAASLAWLLARNGHLYALPGLRLAAHWGVQGAWALLLLLCAAATWLAQRHADLAARAPRLHREGDLLRLVLLGLAALCLLGLPSLAVPLAWLLLAATLATLGFGLAAGVVAVRHRVWNSIAVLAIVAVLGLAALLQLLVQHGIAPDLFWARWAAQLALTASVFLATIAMIGRVAHVRDERDRERLARGDSERRLQREAARTELVQQLQQRLRELPAGDLEWAAFRSVFERLLPLLRLEAGALVAYGFHGFDLLLAEPLSSKAHFAELLASRMGMMKGLARTQSPVQLQLGNGDGTGRRLHAVVPLPLPAPAWGVLLLQRADGAAFSDEELALACDFGRLAVQHADEAAAALNLRRSAELDALTGTFNRRTIDLWLARCFADAHRADQMLAVLFVDIDHFKAINDTHGHAGGDACLRRVAEVLRRELQPNDLLGRYGGEEFVVVLPGRNGDEARQLAEKIRAAVELLRLEWEGRPIRLTVSAGVATRLPEEREPAAAVARADQALYASKRSGRNRVSVAPAVFS